MHPKRKVLVKISTTMIGKISPLRKRRQNKKKAKSMLSELNQTTSSTSTLKKSGNGPTSPISTSTSTSVDILDTPPFTVDNKEAVNLPALADCPSESSVGSGQHDNLVTADLPSLADVSDCGSSFSAGSSSACSTPVNSKRSRRLRRHATASPSVLSPLSLSPSASVKEHEGERDQMARSTMVPVGTEMRIRKGSSQDSLGTTGTTTTMKTMDETVGTVTTVPVMDNDASRVDCNRAIIDSFTSLTSFLTCSANENTVKEPCCTSSSPTNAEPNVSRNVAISPHVPSSNTNSNINNSSNGTAERQPRSSKDIQQLQQVRQRIEKDILTVMGCTADSANNCMNNLGKSIFCNPNERGDDGDDDEHTIASCGLAAGGLLGMRKHNEDVLPKARPSNKARNRNVFLRERALRRIKRLREGGFSRTFNLAPVSAFLEEELKGIGPEGLGGPPLPDHTSPRIHPVGPTSDTDATTAKTSFLRKLGQQYPIQSTQSAEYVTLQKHAREKTYNDKRSTHTTPHDYSNQNYQHDDTDNHSILSTSLLSLPKQFEESIGLIRVTSAASTELSECAELYYDSDPGFTVHEEWEPRNKPDPEPEPDPDPEPVEEVPEPKAPESPKTGAPNYSTYSRHYRSGTKKVRAPTTPIRIKKHRRSRSSKSLITAISETEQKIKEEKEDEETPKVIPKPEKKKENKLLRNVKPSLLYTVDVNTFDVNNTGLVTQFIAELTNGYLSLIWHPTPHQDSSLPANPTPLHTQAWFEMGTCLKSTLIQPKFMWRGLYHSPNDDDEPVNIHNIRGPTLQTPHSVELLNIVRVIAPKSIDRKRYPFCRLTHAFTVGTSQEEMFLFEAATETERNRFVLGLKLVVARLASKIIVGDKGVFDDFFSPWGTRYKAKGKSGGKGKSSNSQTTKRNAMKEQKTTESVCSSNFISASVHKEGGRRDELWGGA